MCIWHLVLEMVVKSVLSFVSVGDIFWSFLLELLPVFVSSRLVVVGCFWAHLVCRSS